jgi:hypothetical protein
MRLTGRIAAVALFFVFAACGSSTPATVALTEGGAGDAHDGAAAGHCGHAVGLDDGGPGACHVAKRSLECTQGDISCGCVTDGDGCDGCPGGTCHDLCHADEYALACGGPPNPDASFSYASPPETCRTIDVTPGGSRYLCCPCL